MSPKFQIKEATTSADFLQCGPVILHHHPHLKTIENILTQLNIQRSEGYRIFYCIEEEPLTPTKSPSLSPATTPEDQDGQRSQIVISYIGFKIQQVFFTGKTLHIADIYTLESARGKGAAGTLLDFIVEFAMKSECDHICLDSTYLRTNAHRLYLNKGFVLNAHHFVLKF